MLDEEFLDHLIQAVRPLLEEARRRHYSTLAYLLDLALMEAQRISDPLTSKRRTDE